jgi:hypothetical protein
VGLLTDLDRRSAPAGALTAPDSPTEAAGTAASGMVVTRGKRLVLEGSRADMGCWRWSSWSWLGRFDSASSVAGGCSQPGSNGNTAGMGFELRDVINLCSGSVSVDELRWRLAGAWAVVRVMLTRYGATRLPSSRVSSLSSPRRPCSWPSYSRSSPSFVWIIF